MTDEGEVIVYDKRMQKSYRRHIPRRMRLFAEAYAKGPTCGNATQSAIKAGYSESGASVQGSRLLRISRVQELIGNHSIKTSVHAEQTYQNLILAGDIAKKEVIDLFGLQHPESKDVDPMARARALEVFGRALERLAKVEGLLLEKPRDVDGDDRVHDLMELAQRFAPQLREKARQVSSVIASIPPKTIIDVVASAGGNGHGHNGNGESHDVSNGESPPSVAQG